MPMIGPGATITVAGIEDHDMGSFEWTVRKEKTGFTPLNKDRIDRFTAGVPEFTWTAEVETKPDGTTAIDWETKCINDEDFGIVIRKDAVTNRFMTCVVDEVGNATQREDGKWTKSVQGKATNWQGQ